MPLSELARPVKNTTREASPETYELRRCQADTESPKPWLSQRPMKEKRVTKRTEPQCHCCFFVPSMSSSTRNLQSTKQEWRYENVIMICIISLFVIHNASFTAFARRACALLSGYILHSHQNARQTLAGKTDRKSCSRGSRVMTHRSSDHRIMKEKIKYKNHGTPGQRDQMLPAF